MPTLIAERVLDIPETVVIDPQTPDKYYSAGYYTSLAQAPVREFLQCDGVGAHFDDDSCSTEQVPYSD